MASDSEQRINSDPEATRDAQNETPSAKPKRQSFEEEIAAFAAYYREHGEYPPAPPRRNYKLPSTLAKRRSKSAAKVIDPLSQFDPINPRRPNYRPGFNDPPKRRR